MRVAGLLAAVALLFGVPALAQITPCQVEGRRLCPGTGRIPGELWRPEGGVVVAPPQGAKFRSLIEVRAHFQPELERSLAKL